MSTFAAQWAEIELPRLVHADEAARLAEVVGSALRTGVRAGAAVMAAAGFAGAMWLLLAGPGFLDGRSSTVDHASRSAARHAAR